MMKDVTIDAIDTTVFTDITYTKNTDGTYDIVLKIADDTPCCNDAVLKFEVKNPSLMPHMSTPTVQANGINIVETRMREGVGDKRPMFITNTALTVAHISQSTDMPCQSNTITVSLTVTEGRRTDPRCV